MSDNEQTSTSLGHSEVLSVKDPPDHAIPEFGKAVDDGGEVSTASRTEEARNIFSDNPLGVSFSNEAMELPPESATVSSQSRTVSCH
jgi:hypothetical protein